MEERTYIEGGIYTNYQDVIAIYCGKSTNSQNELKNVFIEVDKCKKYSRNEIIQYIEDIGIDNIMQSLYMLDCMNRYYDFGYLGRLPDTIYSEINKRMKEWEKKPWKSNTILQQMIPNMKYQEGGIYLDSRNVPAIYCGQYTDSKNKLKNTFIEMGGYQEGMDISTYFEDMGLDTIMKSIYLLHPENQSYSFGFLGYVPEPIYKEIDRRMEQWATLPWQT